MQKPRPLRPAGASLSVSLVAKPRARNAAMPIQTEPPSRKSSWRDVLPIHAAALVFPRPSPAELKALTEDIKTNGQGQPIAIIEKARRRPDGTLHVKDPPIQEVLDGISRLDAMESAGIKVIGKDGELAEQIQRIVI